MKEFKLKTVHWHGNTLDAVRKFPRSVRIRIGSELYLLQIGETPVDSKPMTVVGRSVWELRVRDRKKAYRILYFVKHCDGIHVLHAFQKKTQRTSKPDIELGKSRYRKLQRRK
jgi:phage-related protein